MDLCHPNHPDCVTGTTCGNCKQGFNPHLVVASYMILDGKAPFISDYKYVADTNYIKIDSCGSVSSIHESHPSSSKIYDINIYPNPNFGKFKVDYYGKGVGYFAEIYDFSGKRVYREYIKKNETVNASSLSKGVYLLKLIDENHEYNSRFIIDK